MTDKDLTPFALHLKKNITAMQWSKLREKLNITANSRTRLLTGQRDWLLSEIDIVAKMLNEQPVDLIQEWGLGQTLMTVKEYNQIAQPHGLQVGLVAHVA